MLNCAGPQVQEIYETLNDTGNSFESAIRALDGYFKSLINKFYERFRFQQLEQDPDEPIDKFVSRLQHQAAKCNFADTDGSIIDQVIAKCVGSRLRSKLLEEGNALTLARALVIARTVKSIAVQDKDIASEQKPTEPSLMSSALRVDMRDKRKPFHTVKGHGHTTQPSQCGRCGFKGDTQSDTKCPAKNANCKKCGKQGH